MESVIKKPRTWKIRIEELDLILTKEEHKVADEKIRWKVVRADNNFEFGFVSSYETSNGKWMNGIYLERECGDLDSRFVIILISHLSPEKFILGQRR